MSNILFANQDRLKTIGRFLAYDKLVSLNEHNFKLEEEIVFRGKRYKIKAKLVKVKELKNE
jgi:hypothetical protein